MNWNIEIWIRCFAVLAMVKKLKDEKASGGDNEITDLILAMTGCDAEDTDNGLP